MKFRKIKMFFRTEVAHYLFSLCIVCSYIPIVYSNNLDVVRIFSALALFFYMLYTTIPIDKYKLIVQSLDKYLEENKSNEIDISKVDEKYRNIKESIL